jgi:hypothetical protein
MEPVTAASSGSTLAAHAITERLAEHGRRQRNGFWSMVPRDVLAFR